jgi:hypothetical protein
MSETPNPKARPPGSFVPKTRITLLNHRVLDSAPDGYVVFEIRTGDPSRPVAEWSSVVVERNSHTGGQFRSLPDHPPHLARILDAIDRALVDVAEELEPECATRGCAYVATLTVYVTANGVTRTVAMCPPCAASAEQLAAALDFTTETRPLSETG